MARRTGCASVLVVGGGSTIEVAKSIATLLSSKVNAETLTNPSTREAIIAQAISTAAAAAPMIAVPTTFHGCVAASSNKTYLTDATEGSVFEMSEPSSDRLNGAGGVHVVVDSTLLASSSPIICAEGAISSLARVSDALLINEGGTDTIGHDGGTALGELLGTLKNVLDESFQLYDNNLTSMASWVGDNEENVSEQYGAIGCVVGSCISLGGPGITQSMARVVASNYNVSFGQACAIVLPQVCAIQMARSRKGSDATRGAADVHAATVCFGSGSGSDPTMFQAFDRVRSHVLIPKPSTEELKELTTAVLMDASFKQAVSEDNGKKTWTRSVVADLLEESFAFLENTKEKEAKV